MTGSLSVRGEVLPVGGITAKIEAAMKAGFSEVVIPKANLQDIVIDKRELKKIKVIPVRSLSEVLDNAFERSSQKAKMLKSLKKMLSFSLPSALKVSAKKAVGKN